MLRLAPAPGTARSSRVAGADFSECRCLKSGCDGSLIHALAQERTRGLQLKGMSRTRSIAAGSSRLSRDDGKLLGIENGITRRSREGKQQKRNQSQLCQRHRRSLWGKVSIRLEKTVGNHSISNGALAVFVSRVAIELAALLTSTMRIGKVYLVPVPLIGGSMWPIARFARRQNALGIHVAKAVLVSENTASTGRLKRVSRRSGSFRSLCNTPLHIRTTG